MRRLVPYQIIVEAQSGDGDAMSYILRHYDDYINYYSRRGHEELRMDVNEEVKQQITTKLIIAIVRNFDHTQLPLGERLEEQKIVPNRDKFRNRI